MLGVPFSAVKVSGMVGTSVLCEADGGLTFGCGCSRRGNHAPPINELQQITTRLSDGVRRLKAQSDILNGWRCGAVRLVSISGISQQLCGSAVSRQVSPNPIESVN